MIVEGLGPRLNRAQRRARHAQALALGRTTAEPSAVQARGLAAEFRREIAANKHRPDEAGAMVAACVYSAIDQGVRETADPRIACRSGCAHCCIGMRVETSDGEAHLIASEIEDRPDLAAKVLAAAADPPGTTPIDYVRARRPCPFLDLETSTCAIYDARPAACRAFFSVDVRACIFAAASDDPLAGRPMPAWASDMMGMVGAAAELVRPARWGELSAMVARELRRRKARGSP